MPRHAIALLTLVWLGLAGATLLQWTLGTDQFPGLMSTRDASIALFVVAFIKIRFVIQHFMEVRNAPIALRIVMDVWNVGACAVLIGLYLS